MKFYLHAYDKTVWHC